ncbi:MAG: tetratricopeptide repeat protein [Betaproteobacteria bacterium]|nr:tetratricopeptide repeat protein [Betaproteobacteria bacterium]
MSTEIDNTLQRAFALHQQGELAGAADLYREILGQAPDHFDALHLLGVVDALRGNPESAVGLIRRAIELDAGVPEAHSNLGNALGELGRHEEALQCHERALQLNPGSAEGSNSRGTALQALGRDAEALASFDRALQLNPDHVDALCNRGKTLHILERNEEALASYQRALQLQPRHAQALFGRGNVQGSLVRHEEALASYELALASAPDFAQALNNRAVVLLVLGRREEAMAGFERAVEIDPEYVEAHCNRGFALHELGRPEEAVDSYLRAAKLQPDNLQNLINARLMLPIIPASVEAIGAWRERYRAGIAALMDAPRMLNGLSLNPCVFYLAYHNLENRPVLEALCRFFRARVPVLEFAAPHIEDWRPPASAGRRIRIGFLSEYFGNHTIGMLYRGFIQHLDRARFEVVLMHTTKSMRDSFRNDVLNPLADRVVVLPAIVESKLQAVAAEKLDVLFYPDIGMSMSTNLLAYARLAPVQAVSWGHPETTGLDSMDYFVSAGHIEPPGAEAHYTETLVRLTRLPCFYVPPPIAAQPATRAALGLPESGTLYGCPQTLFKIHPDFDPILEAIALGDPEGWIVFIKGPYPAWAELLRLRWSRSCPALLEKAVFLPGMSRDRFLQLMQNMDVLLDPIHFGSGNTLYEAMALGIPVVTWPGRFMRGRIVAGAYAQMGVAGAPVASRLEDYAPLALSLGRDPERRRQLRQALQDAARRELFADMRTVREFELFVEAAVIAAGRGEKLPAGWRPDVAAG